MFDMHDFDVFYSAAQCWLQGIDPYTCGFLYPLPMIFLFLPFAAFPLIVAKIIWLAMGLVIITVIFKRAVFWYLFYAPILRSLAFGQVDLMLLPAIFLQDGIGMALLTLKPQLIALYLPFWFWGTNGRERKRFITITTLLWGLSFVAWPAWIFHFSTRPIAPAIFTSPSIWGGGYWAIPVVILAGVSLIVFSRQKWPATTAANPFVQTYDLVILLPFARWWIVPLSWIVQVIANRINLAFPYVFLPLAVLLDESRADL